MVNTSLHWSAHKIGSQIATAAVWQHEQCSWMQADRTHLMDGDVYEGTAGVAWFLAHLATATDDPVLSRTAVAAARHALGWVEASPTNGGAGLHSGGLGTLWAVADVGRRLGVAELVDRSHALAPRLLKPSTVMQPVCDVVGGGAGSLISLIGLARHDAALRTAAQQLGEDLAEQVGDALARLSFSPDTNRSGTLPVGLAHGVSGFAWSLMELYALNGEERFRQLAWQGFRYERAWFDRQLYTWRDPASRSPTTASWCQGSCGIGLARLRALEVLPHPQLQAEAGAALAAMHTMVARTLAPTYHRTWEQSNFSVCHGVMGMADLLLFAAEVLDVAAHQEAGQRLVEYGQWLATRAGSWPCGTLDRSPSFGLMLGLAGIGAVLLRFSPAQLPPVGLLVHSTSAKGSVGLSGSSG